MLLYFSARASEKIKVVAVKGLAQQYNKIFLQKNVNVINITELGIKGTSLSLAHLVIMQQALYKGGLDIDFDFVISPNHKRSGALLSSGKAVISSFFSYAEAQPKDTYISSAVMAPRTLKKGIYGLASNKALMRVKSLDDLKPLKGVLVEAWKNDMKILKSHGITQIEVVPKYLNIFTRIAHRGIDYTLLDYPHNDELIQYNNKIKLYPVPNLMLELEGSRHFFISKNHPDGKRVFTALEKGLGIMKDDGTIEKYFRQIKIIRDDFKHYKVLNKVNKNVK